MESKLTERGFGYVPFKDQNGYPCSMQQSSAVRAERMMWLGRDGEGMHLSQSNVAEMLPILQHFVESGDVEVPPEKAKPTAFDAVFDLIFNTVMTLIVITVVVLTASLFL